MNRIAKLFIYLLFICWGRTTKLKFVDFFTYSQVTSFATRLRKPPGFWGGTSLYLDWLYFKPLHLILLGELGLRSDLLHTHRVLPAEDTCPHEELATTVHSAHLLNWSSIPGKKRLTPPRDPVSGSSLPEGPTTSLPNPAPPQPCLNWRRFFFVE